MGEAAPATIPSCPSPPIVRTLPRFRRHDRHARELHKSAPPALRKARSFSMYGTTKPTRHPSTQLTSCAFTSGGGILTSCTHARLCELRSRRCTTANHCTGENSPQHLGQEARLRVTSTRFPGGQIGRQSHARPAYSRSTREPIGHSSQNRIVQCHSHASGRRSPS